MYLSEFSPLWKGCCVGITLKRTIEWSITVTLNSTFEERGKLAVNSEEEANWLSIQRKRQICCQFKVRINQPPVIIYPKRENKVPSTSHSLSLPFLFLRGSGWVNSHGMLNDSFFKLTTNSPVSLNWQPICLFLRIYSYFASFFKCPIMYLIYVQPPILLSSLLPATLHRTKLHFPHG